MSRAASRCVTCGKASVGAFTVGQVLAELASGEIVRVVDLSKRLGIVEHQNALSACLQKLVHSGEAVRVRNGYYQRANAGTPQP